MDDHTLPSKQFVQINVSGADPALWQRLRSKLFQTLNDLLDAVVDTEQGSTVREEAQQLMLASLGYLKEKLARPGLENDKIEAETRRLYAQMELDRAEARKRHAEAEAIELQTKIRRLRVVLGGAHALLLGEQGEEAVVFVQQIDAFLTTLDKLAAS